MQINQVQFAAIVETAKAKAADSPRWIRAIDRAAAALLSGELCVTLLADGALVTSKNGSYRVTNTCDARCKASANGHKECYHRAAVRLMETLEAAPVAAPVRARYCGDRDLQHLDRCAPHIERSVEQDRSGQRYIVERCDGWVV